MSSKLTVAALSGGVDSAVAAAMLVEAGERVVGMTMRLYDASLGSAAVGRCCGPRDIEDARAVCRHLDIPFYVVDFAADFQERVIDDFVDSYLAGETPNPCVKCNQHIKFTPLLQRARALGADSLVTGHYAVLDDGGDGHTALRRGVDASKDQSYFLFSMPPDELASVRFPLGALGKGEVRERATSFGLPNAAKAESQEICFVPDGDYAGFVERSALTRKLKVPAAGAIVDETGEAVGRHDGIHRYTIGQRRGLGAIAGGEPAYVTRIDRDSGTVVVGSRAAAERDRLTVRGVRELLPREHWPTDVAVQVRYRANPVPVSVSWSSQDGELSADLTLSDKVVASPGQSAVFYSADRVLGGGWIARE